MPDQDEMERLVVDLADRVRNGYWGKYRGTVDEVLDEQPPGQIVANVPSVYGDAMKSPPALPALPYAGNGYGLVALPEVGDGVWIEFEGGDPSYPIWTGFWFASDELPDDAGPKQRVFVTKQQLKLVFDDDAEEIRIAHPKGAQVVLTGDALTLKFGDTVQVVLSQSGVDINNGAFKVSAG